MVYAILGGIRTDEEQQLRYDLGFRDMHFVFSTDVRAKPIKLVDTTPDDGGVINQFSIGQGRALVPETVPKSTNRIGPSVEHLPLLDVENIWGPNVPLVRQDVKELIKSLEPDVHQFIPVELMVNGEHAENRFAFVCCVRLATLSREHSFPPLNDRGFWKPSPLEQSQNDKIIFSTQQIGSHHLWYDKFFGYPMCSNSLAERLKALNLTGLKLHEYPEI